MKDRCRGDSRDSGDWSQENWKLNPNFFTGSLLKRLDHANGKYKGHVFLHAIRREDMREIPSVSIWG